MLTGSLTLGKRIALLVVLSLILVISLRLFILSVRLLRRGVLVAAEGALQLPQADGQCVAFFQPFLLQGGKTLDLVDDRIRQMAVQRLIEAPVELIVGNRRAPRPPTPRV